MKQLTIGKIAKATGVKNDTLRFYERLGLIETEGREANGYRVFHLDTIKRLQFIQQAKLLDFTLDEIKDLLVIKASSKARCEDVYQKMQGKIAEVGKKITELQSFKRSLQTIAKNCPRGNTPIKNCSLMDFLDKAPACHPVKKPALPRRRK